MYSDNIVFTEEHLERVVDYFIQQDAFSFDVETTGSERGVAFRAPIVWMSMATNGMAVAIPMGHPNGDRLIAPAHRKKDPITGKMPLTPAVWSAPPKQLRPSVVFRILRRLFFNEDIRKIAHNATFDLVATDKYFGETVPGPYADTIVMCWLLDENLLSKKLKDLCKSIYGADYDKEGVGKSVESWGFSKIARYAYLDAKFTWLLYLRYLPRLQAEGLTGIWNLENDVLEALLQMNLTGAPVDVETITSLEVELAEELVEIEGRIYRAAGKQFNINSNPQKTALLFGAKADGNQGLKPRKLTEGGKKAKEKGETLLPKHYSVAGEVLELYPGNKLCVALLEYAEVHKLLNTYLRAWLGVEGDPDKPCRIFNGRIHADFVQYGTVTGRFSCREPNLQNIPRPDTELGKKMRGMFIAPPGHKLIVADYGQIELVILAHYLQRGALYKGFLEGIDPHTITAALVLNKDPKDVTPVERQKYGKSINFAVVYGAGPEKVAAMMGTSITEAKKFLAIHQRMFPEIYSFKDFVIATARERRPPHIKTLLGRKRRLPKLLAKDFKGRGYAERQAVNSLIQGSSADIIKLAMVRLDRTLPDDMHLILSVHDELVTICPDDRTDLGVEIVREAMLGEGVTDLLAVPLASDIKVVSRWSEAK